MTIDDGSPIDALRFNSNTALYFRQISLRFEFSWRFA
jgi:hypothetical protein